MNQDTLARGAKHVVARWENRTGKRFIEVYGQTRDGQYGCGYDSHLGSQWWPGVSLSRGLNRVEADFANMIAGLEPIPVSSTMAA